MLVLNIGCGYNKINEIGMDMIKTPFTIYGLRYFLESNEFQMHRHFKIKKIKLNGRFSRFFSRYHETFKIFIRFVHYFYEIEF